MLVKHPRMNSSLPEPYTASIWVDIHYLSSMKCSEWYTIREIYVRRVSALHTVDTPCHHYIRNIYMQDWRALTIGQHNHGNRVCFTRHREQLSQTTQQDEQPRPEGMHASPNSETQSEGQDSLPKHNLLTNLNDIILTSTSNLANWVMPCSKQTSCIFEREAHYSSSWYSDSPLAIRTTFWIGLSR